MKDIAKLTKKVLVAVKVVKVASLCFTVGATVHSLIPKYDKIEGVNTDRLIETHRAK